LIDPRNEEAERDSRAALLGEKFRHRYCIPALLAVLRDRSEPHGLRQRCLQSISAINDARVVDYLVELIPEEVLGSRANENLMMITGVSVGIINLMKPDPGGAFRRTLQDRWRRWWKHNRDKVALKNNSLASDALFYKELKEVDLDK
jgi:hypothetical protein